MVHHVLRDKFEWPFGLQAQIPVEKNIPGFVYRVTNLDEEIYFHGGGPNVVGDPLSGEVGPDCIMWICSLILVVYGWSADVTGFLVEKISGQTLEQFWYVN